MYTKNTFVGLLDMFAYMDFCHLYFTILFDLINKNGRI